MTKQCCICGCEFQPRHKRQVTCGSPECQRKQHNEYVKRYNFENRARHREYNREWMRRARRAKGEDLVRDYSADSYAERQKQRTLALIGGVDLGQKL